MTDDYTIRFAILCLAGFGMILAGGLNLVFARAAAWWRVPLAGAAGSAVAGAGMLALPPGATEPALIAAGLVAAGVVVCLLVGPALVVNRLATAGLARPAVRWALLAIVGLAAVGGSALDYNRADAARTDLDMVEIGLEGFVPSLADATDARAVTDRGTPVPLKRPTAPRTTGEAVRMEQEYLRQHGHTGRLICRGPSDDRSNCHGWVFTDGRNWLGGTNVEQVLAENGYTLVSDPRPGDLAIYRQSGNVSHTALVRYVTDGMPVLVEGKWGSMGVYLHPVAECPYGTEFTYFRSPRRGHVLAGLTDAPSAP